MPRYEKAPLQVREIGERMMDRYHPDLRDAKVDVCYLMAFPTTDKNGDSTGPPIKFQGYPAAAVVKIIGLKERTDGRADAEVVIDGDKWPTLSGEEQDALIDHELTHLELKTDKHGALVRDDLDRPKLKMRRHDHQFGWFDCVVRRHGKNALEHQQFVEFQNVAYEQRWLPFLDTPDTTPEKARVWAGTGDAVVDAVDELQQSIDENNSGIESVTFSSGDKSATLKRGSGRAFAGKKSSGGRRAAAHA